MKEHASGYDQQLNNYLEQVFSGVNIGITIGRSHETGHNVFQATDDRMRHLMVLGKTGCGKSNTVHSLERLDIRHGSGVGIICSHNEDADYPLTIIPEDRIDDLIFLDFSNPRFLPGMNPLLGFDSNDKAAADKAVEDTISLLKHGVYHSFAGPCFDHLARLALMTIMHPQWPYDRSIAHIANLFVARDFRKKALSHIQSKQLHAQWAAETAASTSRDYDDMLSWFVAKFHQIVSNKTLRAVLCAEKNTVDIKLIMDQSKILVAKIPSAKLGESVSSMLSAYLVKQIKDATLQRESDKDGSLKPFFVYIDEFARHASIDLANLLAEARKFQVSFTLATQSLALISKFNKVTGYQDNNVLESILGNVGSFLCFRVGSLDARIMSEQLDLEDPSIIKRLGRYQVLASLLIDNQEVRPMIIDMPAAPKAASSEIIATIESLMIAKGIWLPIGPPTAQTGPDVEEASVEQSQETAFLDRMLQIAQGSKGPKKPHPSTPVIDPSFKSFIDSCLAVRAKVLGASQQIIAQRLEGVRLVNLLKGRLAQTKTSILPAEDRLLEELGLGAFPDEIRQVFMREFHVNLESLVGEELTRNMPSELLDEFAIFVEGDLQEMKQWLHAHDSFYWNKREFKQMKAKLADASPEELLSLYGSNRWLMLNKSDYPDIVEASTAAFKEELRRYVLDRTVAKQMQKG